MGYISSATTTALDLHMTAYGRRFLLEGSLADQIISFALGDPDTDYRNSVKLPSGYVPDVTGSHLNCIFEVNDGYEQKDKIIYIEDNSSLNTLTNDKTTVLGFKNKTGDYDWSTRAGVNVYVHDYLGLIVGMAQSQAGHHQFGNFSANTQTNYFTTIKNSSNQAYSLNMPGLYADLEKQGRSLITNIFDQVMMRQGGRYVPTNVTLRFVAEKDRNMFEKLSGAAWIDSSNQPVVSKTGAERGVRKKKQVASPFTFINNTYTATDGRAYMGGGNFGFGFGRYEYGYNVAKVIDPNSNFYPSYGFETNFGGMYSQYVVENPSFNKELEKSALNSIIPAAKINLDNNLNTNAYYILQTNQLSTLSKTDNFRANPNSNRVGSTLTESSFALETFLSFAAGTAEYQITTNTRGYDRGMEKVQPNTNYEPFTMVTRLISETVDFFDALKQDNTVGKFIVKSGSSLTDSIYTVPMSFLVDNTNDPTCKSATLDVNFIFSVPALLENVKYDLATPTTGARYRMYADDRTTPRFFGGDYTMMGGAYTINPVDDTTPSGATIFRKTTLN
tara:strand:+ start:15970 stop:17646 length:1677 start_codon:yes stop_codon:yes gene_type:complete